MVSTGYSDYGEEWSQKLSYRQDQIVRDTSLEILIYNDSTDNLGDSNDIGDITTEPTDGNYTRQTVTLDGADVTLTQTGGDIRAEASVTFDTTNTTGTVDAWGAVNDFQSDVVNAEGAANPHLISTATFAGGSRDLSDYNSIDVTIQLDLN